MSLPAYLDPERLDTSFARARLPADLRAHVEPVVDAFSPALSASEREAQIQAEVDQMRRNVVWRSSTHQINIDPTRATLHYSVKRNDRQPILSRDVLIALGEHFSRGKGHVCVELLPAESRVVDTANQYHLWRIRDPRVPAEMVKAALRRPGEAVALPDGGRLLHLNTGALRDWRLLQQVKNAQFGAEAEAIDLLLPMTRGEGPLVLALPEQRRFAFGWDSRLVCYEDAGAARQRPR